MAEVVRMTVEQWRDELERRAGGTWNWRNVGFRCPLCGNVATGADFEAAGADPKRAPQECIGRVVGAKGGLRVKVKKGEPMPQPCDWAAFGLFGTLNGGIVVDTGDGGTMNSFSFA